MANHGAVSWFEIGTADPAQTHAFYGELFGWTYQQDPDAGELPYELVTTVDEQPKGGLWATGGEIPSYGVFYVEVDDVAATVANAEANGGKVLVPRQSSPNGLTFAHLLDPQGVRFGVFSPAE